MNHAAVELSQGKRMWRRYQQVGMQGMKLATAPPSSLYPALLWPRGEPWGRFPFPWGKPAAWRTRMLPMQGSFQTVVSFTLWMPTTVTHIEVLFPKRPSAQVRGQDHA
jgi:hypothetical protein